MSPSLALVHPPAEAVDGNAVSARRWERIFRELGFTCEARDDWDGQPHDALVALHAHKSHSAVARFGESLPDAPILVVAAGTDIYGEAAGTAQARESFEAADRIIVLQPEAVRALSEPHRERARVIHQSVEPLHIDGPRPLDPESFDVFVMSNLRPIKDPLCAARAARLSSPASRLHVYHCGRMLDPELRLGLEEERRNNPRYTWMGTLTREEAFLRILGSRAVLSTSLHEGGANAVGEAIAHRVPVIATRIPGSIGLLGADYPGLYGAGDERELAALLERAESDPAFLDELQRLVTARAPCFLPDVERKAWRRVFEELGVG